MWIIDWGLADLGALIWLMHLWMIQKGKNDNRRYYGFVSEDEVMAKVFVPRVDDESRVILSRCRYLPQV